MPDVNKKRLSNFIKILNNYTKKFERLYNFCFTLNILLTRIIIRIKKNINIMKILKMSFKSKVKY